MEETTTQLARQIDDEKRDLDRNLEELKVKAKSSLDWREQFQKHPGIMLGAALGGGFLLAQLGRAARRGPAGSTPRPPRVRGPRGDGAISALGGALIATTANGLVKFLADAIPGFRDEYETRRSESRRSDRVTSGP